MELKKFMWIPVIVGIISAFLQVVDSWVSPFMLPRANVGFGWVAFQATAMYFLAGGTVKGGIKNIIGYTNGIIVSILIFVIGNNLASLGFYAYPVAIIIVVTPALFLERNEWTDLIPALFIGAGAYFGFMSYVPGATYQGAALTIFTYCLIGQAFGYSVVKIRGAYENFVMKPDLEEAK